MRQRLILVCVWLASGVVWAQSPGAEPPPFQPDAPGAAASPPPSAAPTAAPIRQAPQRDLQQEPQQQQRQDPGQDPGQDPLEDAEDPRPAARQPAAQAPALPGFFGPVGLLRVSAADAGGVGHLRLGLHGEFFSGDSFLVERDQSTRLAGSFTLGYTPLPGIELFAALLGSSNRNRRRCEAGACISEAGRRDPEVIRSLGDVVLGGKFVRPAGPMLSIGGQAGIRLMSSVAGLGIEPSATSVFVDGLATIDLRKTSAALPIAGHLNVGYYADNSGELSGFAGASQASQLVSSFAYNMARSRVRAALGATAQLDLTPSVSLSPFAEYHLEVVTAKADVRFREYLPPLCAASPSGAQKACADARDQQWFTMGTRVGLPGGVGLLAAVDLGIASVGYPYGPPITPYQIMVGVAAPLDLLGRSESRVVTRTIVVDRPSPGAGQGHVVGVVKHARTGAPVADAVVSVPGQPRSRVLTDPDGSFLSPSLPLGSVELEITARGFEAARVRAEVVATTPAPIEVALAPVAEPAKVHGRITAPDGRPIAGGLVRFVGPTTAEVRTDAGGVYSATLAAGTYAAHAEAPTAFSRDVKLTLRAGEDQDAWFTLKPRPATPGVRVVGDRLSLRRPIGWKPGPAGTPLELTPATEQLLEEVADLMSREPRIRKLVVEAHWDDSLDADRALELTKKQAQVVVDRLIQAGVAPERLEPRGLGGAQPVAPNLGPANRMRNRRVELKSGT